MPAESSNEHDEETRTNWVPLQKRILRFYGTIPEFYGIIPSKRLYHILLLLTQSGKLPLKPFFAFFAGDFADN